MNRVERFFTRIRTGVFETNSSSCHTVTIEKNNTGLNYDQFDKANIDDNKLHINLETFGWEYREIHDATTKLEYYICMIIETMKLWTNSWKGDNSRKEEYWYNQSKVLYGFYEFKEVENLIKEKLGYDGIVIDNLYESNYIQGFRDKKAYTRYTYEYGIDHQSCEDYGSAHEFLDEYKVSLEDFIFNPSVVLITQNDNSGPRR